jgi:hypothetical protein
MCRWLGVIHALANIHYAPLWLGVMRGTGPTPRITKGRDANDLIFAPLICKPGTGEQDYAVTSDRRLYNKLKQELINNY